MVHGEKGIQRDLFPMPKLRVKGIRSKAAWPPSNFGVRMLCGNATEEAYWKIPVTFLGSSCIQPSTETPVNQRYLCGINAGSFKNHQATLNC